MLSAKVVAILTVLSVANGIWLESPKVTNWGVWGEAEYCDPAEVVYGFRLKVQQEQGPLIDDTALNGIELHCVKTITGPRNPITSLVGDKGAWGSTKECPGTSYGVGFEMRTEAATIGDNTAANNFRLYCSDNTVVEGAGLTWGEWTGALFCPSNMRLCGMKTQVENAVPGNPPIWGTGTNNVDLFCCDRSGNRVKLSK